MNVVYSVLVNESNYAAMQDLTFVGCSFYIRMDLIDCTTFCLIWNSQTFNAAYLLPVSRQF